MECKDLQKTIRSKPLKLQKLLKLESYSLKPKRTGRCFITMFSVASALFNIPASQNTDCTRDPEIEALQERSLAFSVPQYGYYGNLGFSQVSGRILHSDNTHPTRCNKSCKPQPNMITFRSHKHTHTHTNCKISQRTPNNLPK